jgi:hypothetical protein
MSQQIFLNTEQILSLMFTELPEGVYATDRADDPDPNKRSVSSSELRAQAMVLSALYQNLLGINSDKSITTVTEDGLASWEMDLFASAQDGSLGYAVRQQNLLAKIRANGGISLPAIQSIVSAILTPLGLPFQILPYSGQSNGTVTGSWVLDESVLDVSTWLASLDPLIGTGLGVGETPLDCNLDYAAAGISQSDLVSIQMTAYTYEVQIYGNADAATLALLDRQLTALEPARSTHVITNNAAEPIAP